MEKLTLEELEEIVAAYDFERDASMDCKSLCDRDAQKIFYNPFEISSQREFYLTLLHEIVHAADANDILGEVQTEEAAERNYADKTILTYVKKVFPYSLCSLDYCNL